MENEHIILRRPDLFAKLATCIELPLTCVVAGAGYGKTQTVLSFLSENNIDHIWQSLTELDNNVTRYWENFIVNQFSA